MAKSGAHAADTAAVAIKNMDGTKILDATPNISTDIFGAIAVESNPFNSQDRINHQERKFLKVDKRIMQWTDILAEMEALLQLGSGLRNMLYTSRSAAKALPQVNDQNRKAKKIIYTESFNVLQPRINQLLMLTDILESIKSVVQRAVQFWQQNNGKETSVPESVEERIIEILDLLVQLDNLKDMKASILNDFSHYKRCLANVREDQVNDYDSDVKRLTQFLANAQSPKSHMFMEVRSAIQKIPRYEFVLASIAGFCLNRVEQELFMTPEEKHRYLRVIPHLFLLIDKQDSSGSVDDGVNVFALKSFKTRAYKELFKKYPVVPLFRDMHVSMIVILSRCPHFPADRRWKWEPEIPPDGVIVVPEQYEISSKCWAQMRGNYDIMTSQFVHIINNVKQLMSNPHPTIKDATKEDKFMYIRSKLGEQIRETVIKCFCCLRNWSARVKQQLAWKYSHPSNRPAAPGEKRNGKFAVYEAAVLRNFTAMEKTALVDAISMIKTLCGLMLKSQALLSPILRSQVHHEMQQFVQEDMRRLLTRLLKKKKCVQTQSHLRNLRDMVADWDGATLPKVAEEIFKSRKKKDYRKITFKGRVVGPSYAQLNLYRSLLASLYDPNSEGMKGGLFSFKDFDADGVKLMDLQYRRSFFYPYLLSYDSVIRDMSDMGDLLFREYYLELARAEQFPLKTSLPWILLDHVLQARNSINSVDNIVTTLDIYNDAAQRALHVIRQQYMYDEIEAEVNLVFDQLTVLLTEKIYTFHKDKAATLLLPPGYTLHPDQVDTRKRRFQVDKDRFEVAIAQKHLKLLGRTIDLNLILSQYITNTIIKDLETAVSTFEAKNLTFIYDLSLHLDILRLTHKLMVEAGLTLDPFDTMYQQTLDSSSPTAFTNRVTMHVVDELNTNVLQWYIYNTTTQRFVLTDEARGEAGKERPKVPKVRNQYFLFGRKCKNDYSRLCGGMHGFFGLPHCKAILKVLGVTALPLIVRFCTERVEEKLMNMILPCLQTFADELPLWTHPNAATQEAFKASTLYIRFKQTLLSLAKSEDLRPIVMHSFREIGNTLVFLRLLEDQMSTVDVRNYVHVAPMLNLRPPNSNAQKEAKTSPFDESVNALLSEYGTAGKLKGKLTAKDILDKANKIRAVYSHPVEKASLLRPVLIEMQNVLQDEEFRTWFTETPSNGAIEFTPRHEFHRLWSMILFMFSMTDDSNTDPHNTAGDLCQFGDGFVWGGAAIVHLLGQRKAFELLDISSYLLAILHQELWHYPLLSNQVCPPAMYSQESIQLFFQRSGTIRRLNEYVFALLESELMAPTLKMNFFHPPEDDTLIAEQIRTGRFKEQTNIRASTHKQASLQSAASSASSGAHRAPRPKSMKRHAPLSSSRPVSTTRPSKNSNPPAAAPAPPPPAPTLPSPPVNATPPLPAAPSPAPPPSPKSVPAPPPSPKSVPSPPPAPKSVPAPPPAPKSVPPPPPAPKSVPAPPPAPKSVPAPPPAPKSVPAPPPAPAPVPAPPPKAQSESDDDSDGSGAGLGELVKAKWKYEGEADDELSFPKGAMIKVIGKEDDGWWEGEYNGTSGFFPGNYVA